MCMWFARDIKYPHVLYILFKDQQMGSTWYASYLDVYADAMPIWVSNYELFTGSCEDPASELFTGSCRFEYPKKMKSIVDNLPK